MTIQDPTMAQVASDPQMMESFIKSHEPFILSSASRVVGRFITKEDDEWAIALEAFHKAVLHYDDTRGAFFAFANLIIRNSIFDAARINKKLDQEILTDSFDENTTCDNTVPDIRQEIEELDLALKQYGISFNDLAAASPKATKTKEACSKAVVLLLKNAQLLRELKATKLLPIKQMQLHTAIPRKILDRHRKYIIAVVEILDGDYNCLAEYVKKVKEVER